MSLDNLGTVDTPGGFSFMSGVLVGFFIKKVPKVLAIIAGLIMMMTIAYLSFQGVLRAQQRPTEWRRKKGL